MSDNKEKIICYCDNCHTSIFSETDKAEFDGKIYCDNCAEELLVECEDCGELFYKNDCVIIDGRFLCQPCAENYRECVNCGDICSFDDMVLWHSHYYCNNCFESYFAYCENCDEYYLAGEIHWSSEEQCHLCERCMDRIEGHQIIENLHSYNYRPCFNFYLGKYEKTISEKKLFFGIELEVEKSSGDIKKETDNLPEFVFAKEDGSLYNGFEIVSHPATYQWLKENADKWLKILTISKRGFISFKTDSCGIHIHLSKNYFGTWHLYRLLKFFYENPEFILKISQRNKSNLNQWATLDKVVDENKGRDLIYKAKNKNGNHERHCAVNLQNPDTIEIRIFRGTLNPLSFWKNIEFLQALVNYTFETPSRYVNVASFLDYVKNYSKEFNNLYRWLKNKGFY